MAIPKSGVKNGINFTASLRWHYPNQVSGIISAIINYSTPCIYNKYKGFFCVELSYSITNQV
jgi:hypothetical protein